jgi:flagellar hook assembly protein FlgD
MRSLTSMFLIGMICLIVISADNVAPENLNLHFANVSDKAEIELKADQIYSGKAPNHDIEFRDGDLANKMVIHDRTAVMKFGDGESIEFEKTRTGWKITNSQSAPASRRQIESAIDEPTLYGGFSAGETFIPMPISKSQNIDRLTRATTRSKLNRQLFSAPEKSASYFQIEYLDEAPFVNSTYIKLVLDPEWNRILYGNLNHWIKSFDDVIGPASIAIDPTARVFIGETGRERIAVLQINGEGEEARLEFQFEIPNVANPADIAHHDGATPFDLSDDVLYVADPSENKILKYAVDATGYTLLDEFGGFDSPTNVQTGKWNGASSNVIYVIDKVGRRIRAFEDSGSELILKKEINGRYDQYFQDIKVDHFGNVYVIDHVDSRLMKYNSDLDLLDETGGPETFNGLSQLDIPFGKVTVAGQSPKWIGFDQAFALERWTETSGARRLQLGLALRNITFQTDGDISHLTTGLTLTDEGDMRIRFYDENEDLIRTIQPGWQTAGRKQIPWDRRNDSGAQVAPGQYRIEISAASSYRDERTTQNTQLYMPLYYWEDCGSLNPLHDTHLIQGDATAWGESPTLTAAAEASSVQYRFDGLNPESKYQLAAEFYSGDRTTRNEVIEADGFPLSNVSFAAKAVKTNYLDIPAEAYQDGQVTISFNSTSDASALVSQLWLKETGADLNLKPWNAEEGFLSEYFVLEQNYPNPFNPETTIRFRTAESGKVDIAVFDILGRKVRTLVNETLSEGSHSIIWDGRNESGQSLASGIYFYRMQLKGHVQTKRMILLK